MEFWKNTKYVSSFNHSLFFINVLISRKSKVCRRYRCEGEYPAMEFISSGCSAIAWYLWWCISQFQAWPTPLATPRGFARSHCPGGRVFPNFLCPGGRGFELEKFPEVLKENVRTFWFTSKKPGQLEKQMSLCCFNFHINFCQNSRCLLYL